MVLLALLLFVPFSLAVVIPERHSTFPTQEPRSSTAQSWQTRKLLKRDLSDVLRQSDGIPVKAPPGFEWDITCDDPSQLYAIQEAIEDAFEMADVTVKTLNGLKTVLPYYTTGDTDAENNLNALEDNDRAYIQMFGAQYKEIDRVKAVFQNILTQLSDPAAANAPFPDLDAAIHGVPDIQPRQGRLTRIVCDSKARVKETNGAPSCPSSANGADTLAVTYQTPLPGELYLIEEKYQFPDRPTMVFCPQFFRQLSNRVFAINAVNNNANNQCSLHNLNSQAVIALHEMTHLRWVGANVNSARLKRDDGTFYRVEVYGWLDCALLAAEEEPWEPDGFGATSLNADSYAWYAVYNMFNRIPGCLPPPNQCIADVWPPEVEKPVDITELF